LLRCFLLLFSTSSNPFSTGIVEVIYCLFIMPMRARGQTN
jgi:hypothetical protein